MNREKLAARLREVAAAVEAGKIKAVGISVLTTCDNCAELHAENDLSIDSDRISAPMTLLGALSLLESSARSAVLAAEMGRNVQAQLDAMAASRATKQ